MKRTLTLSALAMVVLFILLVLTKQKSAKPSVSTLHKTTLSASEKEKIKDFWEIYRSATDSRLEGDWPAAAIAYKQALLLNPEHKDALYYSGNIFFEVGEYDSAVTVWSKLIEVNPLSKRAHMQLGTLYSSGIPGVPFDLSRAEQEFLHALEINKEESGSLLRLGSIYVLMGNFPKAEPLLKTALQINFKSIEAAYLLGFLNWKSGDIEVSLEYLKRAVGLTNRKLAAQKKQEDIKSQKRSPWTGMSNGPQSYFTDWIETLQNYGDAEITEDAVNNEYSQLHNIVSKINMD